MGVLADTALEAGGGGHRRDPGRAAARAKVGHQGLPDLRIVGSMHERKALMSELADACRGRPGGIGTLEELIEVYTWSMLGIHAKPVGLLDVAGYSGPLSAWLDHAVMQRFLRPSTATCSCATPSPRCCWTAWRRRSAPARHQVARPA